jgi:hypothetical protein
MFFMLPVLYRKAWGSKFGLELKLFQPTISPVPLIAVATETLPCSVLILVAFPPLNITAIAAVGLEDVPAATPELLRAEAFETWFPESVPRSVTVYVWAMLCDDNENNDSAANAIERLNLLVVDICFSL